MGEACAKTMNSFVKTVNKTIEWLGIIADGACNA